MPTRKAMMRLPLMPSWNKPPKQTNHFFNGHFLTELILIVRLTSMFNNLLIFLSSLFIYKLDCLFLMQVLCIIVFDLQSHFHSPSLDYTSIYVRVSPPLVLCLRMSQNQFVTLCSHIPFISLAPVVVEKINKEKNYRSTSKRCSFIR